MNKDYMNVDKEIIKKSINKKTCSKVKFFYINKINKLRRLTIQIMNKINNNQEMAENIYTEHISQLQQMNFYMEKLEEELINIKNEIKTKTEIKTEN
jgi:hypothetical protein